MAYFIVLVPRTGFEPVSFDVKNRRPKPLDQRGISSLLYDISKRMSTFFTPMQPSMTVGAQYLAFLHHALNLANGKPLFQHFDDGNILASIFEMKFQRCRMKSTTFLAVKRRWLITKPF